MLQFLQESVCGDWGIDEYAQLHPNSFVRGLMV